MEVIGGGGELEGGGVVAVDRDHWCGSARCRRVACVLENVLEKPEKETILGKTSGFDSAKGTTHWVTTRFHVCKHHHRVEKRQGKCFILPTIDFIPKTF